MKKSSKRLTQVRTALDSLDKDDIYSLMLFALYKLRDMPEYLALSELCYVLDGSNLPKFLTYFGGKIKKHRRRSSPILKSIVPISNSNIILFIN